MGQKVHPTGMRLGITEEHRSIWYAEGAAYADNLHIDYEVREFLFKKLKSAGISRVDIKRPSDNILNVEIEAARPGIIIGKKGGDVGAFRDKVQKISAKSGGTTKSKTTIVHINIKEVRRPELNSKLVAENIADQLVKRIAFRRAMKRAVQNAMRLGAQGIKVKLSGRLSGAEIARNEWYREGRVPLHTFRAKIDYATAEAHTTYGVIGVKVWIFKGEVLANKGQAEKQSLKDDTTQAPKAKKKLSKTVVKRKSSENTTDDGDTPVKKKAKIIKKVIIKKASVDKTDQDKSRKLVSNDNDISTNEETGG
ncbi:MAG: 30S ribosomal protein S3 [Gammaproteobacteria bacterium]|nr:30S ribosomal protein S3 [Gammaproteobacteria bacterium]